MKTIISVFLISFLFENIVFCDIIRLNGTSENKGILEKEVIVIFPEANNSSVAPLSSVTFYKWNQEKGFLEKKYLKGGQFSVDYSSKENREQLIYSLLLKGVHAVITESDSKESELYSVHFSYGAPNGYYLSNALHEDDCQVEIVINDMTEALKLSEIQSITIENFITIIQMRDGREKIGTWVTPICSDGSNTLRQSVIICGFSAQLEYIKTPLSNIKSLRNEPIASQDNQE